MKKLIILFILFTAAALPQQAERKSAGAQFYLGVLDATFDDMVKTIPSLHGLLVDVNGNYIVDANRRYVIVPFLGTIPSNYELLVDANGKYVVDANNKYVLVPKEPLIVSNLNFVPFESNPIIEPSGLDDWKRGYVGDAFIVYKDSFYLFYYGRHSWPIPNTAENGLATSTDLVTWHEYSGNPILTRGAAGEWDDADADKPIIILKNGVYYQFYVGVDSLRTHNRIGVATSTDLLNWTKYGGNPIFQETGVIGDWDGGFVQPGAIVLKDGIYYMFYFARPLGGASSVNIGIATSTDLLNWTRYSDAPVISVSNSGWDSGWLASGSSIVSIDGVYIMMYNAGNSTPVADEDEPGTRQAGIAYSYNLFDWHKYSGNPLLKPSGVGWDCESVWRTFLFKHSNNLYVFYNANGNATCHTDALERIGYKVQTLN